MARNRWHVLTLCLTLLSLDARFRILCKARYKESLMEKCRELFKEIDKLNDEENDEYGDSDLEELGTGKPIDSGAIEEAIRKLMKEEYLLTIVETKVYLYFVGKCMINEIPCPCML